MRKILRTAKLYSIQKHMNMANTEAPCVNLQIGENSLLKAVIITVNCNLIGQYSVVLLFILTFDCLMESIQIFLKLDGLYKAEVIVPVKFSNLF